jgi:hypothetical protein
MDAISNVWCTVTPPSYDGAGALPELSLAWDEGAARYQAWYDGMVRTGVYVVTFLAADAVGEIAPPVQAVITRVDTDIDGDRLPDWWERSYFAGATNAAPDEDSDGDGQSNADEYATGTVPTDRGSRFAIRSCDSPGVTGRFSLRWDTVARRRYHVYATPDLLVPWPTGAIYSVDGDGAPHAFTNDTPASPCRLFRLSVELTE